MEFAVNHGCCLWLLGSRRMLLFYLFSRLDDRNWNLEFSLHPVSIIFNLQSRRCLQVIQKEATERLQAFQQSFAKVRSGKSRPYWRFALANAMLLQARNSEGPFLMCAEEDRFFFFGGGQVEISLQKLHLFPVKSDILSSGSWGGDHLSLLFPIASKWICQNIKLDYLQNHIFSYHIFNWPPIHINHSLPEGFAFGEEPKCCKGMWEQDHLL